MSTGCARRITAMAAAAVCAAAFATDHQSLSTPQPTYVAQPPAPPPPVLHVAPYGSRSEDEPAPVLKMPWKGECTYYQCVARVHLERDTHVSVYRRDGEAMIELRVDRSRDCFPCSELGADQLVFWIDRAGITRRQHRPVDGLARACAWAESAEFAQ